MDLSKIFDLLLQANLNNDAISDLINEASNMDLNDEESIRSIIRKGALVANKKISTDVEDKIITLVKEKGINNDLLSSLK